MAGGWRNSVERIDERKRFVVTIRSVSDKKLVKRMFFINVFLSRNDSLLSSRRPYPVSNYLHYNDHEKPQ
jgi:hypothetical protein